MTDTISDTLTRIRNANMLKYQIVKIPRTKISLAITRILKEEGFIKHFQSYVKNNKKFILITLKYLGNRKRGDKNPMENKKVCI